MKVMVLKSHGEGQILKNIMKCDRMVFSNERNDVEAIIFLKRKKARLSRHGRKSLTVHYWMNHSWLEDQKFKPNNAQYRESGHTHKSPRKYVFRKMDLLCLVYDYVTAR